MAESPLGKPLNRVDGRLKVTGAATYSADRRPDQLAHGYLVLSTIGKGTIASMTTDDAERSPGVLAVYTPSRGLSLLPDPGGWGGQNWTPLQDTQIRYHGQVIGLVVAETFEQARAAAGLITVRYTEAPVAASLDDGIPNATQAPEGIGGPTRVEILADGVASIEAALAGSAVTISATYSQPIEHHAQLEPHAIVACWLGDQLTVYSGSQTPGGHAQSIATALGLAATQVRVITPHIGGAFGGKFLTWANATVTAAAARALGRPVKTILTREQMFTITGHRSAVRQTVTLGAAADGSLTVVKHEGYSGLSTSGGILEQSAGVASRNLYRTPNLWLRQLAVTLDVPPCTIMRAPGEESGSFGLECAMDELADRLGVDPIELRLRNYATVVPGTTTPWSSKHLDECYRVGAQRFGWSRRPARPGSRIDGDWAVGMGMASALLGAYSFPAEARVRFAPDGTAAVACATVDLGTGMWTVITMVGADALGIDVRRIRPSIGDSTLPTFLGAIGSSSTASVSSAVASAASAAKTALIRHAVQADASPLRGVDESAVTYRDGYLVGGGRRVPFGELLAATRSPGVEGVGSGTGAGQDRAYNSFAAHFCEVRVHRITGEPRITRFTTVVDAGRVVNAKTARSQVIGGVVFGIGQALLEGARLEPDTGRIANANLADYLIPVSADVPAVDVHFLEYPDTGFNPFGARGLGEVGTVGSAAAIANAIFNATGLRVRDLPITLDKLLV